MKKIFKDKFAYKVTATSTCKRFNVVYVNLTQNKIIKHKFSGTITECESWINLQKNGYIVEFI